jgi:hypothetical protein
MLAGDVTVESEWLGLIEMLVVLMFAIVLGAIELYTRRLDKRRAEEDKRMVASDEPPESR